MVHMYVCKNVDRVAQKEDMTTTRKVTGKELNIPVLGENSNPVFTSLKFSEFTILLTVPFFLRSSE